MRYIDADALIKKIYPIGIGDGKYTINAKAVKLAIDNAPTADVVPKSEVEKWYYEYHFIKDELKQEKMYHRETEKLADKYCAELQTAKSEVAREIFEEIERMCIDTFGNFNHRVFAELKKKYTEGAE